MSTFAIKPELFDPTYFSVKEKNLDEVSGNICNYFTKYDYQTGKSATSNLYIVTDPIKINYAIFQSYQVDSERGYGFLYFDKSQKANVDLFECLNKIDKHFKREKISIIQVDEGTSAQVKKLCYMKIIKCKEAELENNNSNSDSDSETEKLASTSQQNYKIKLKIPKKDDQYVTKVFKGENPLPLNTLTIADYAEKISLGATVKFVIGVRNFWHMTQHKNMRRQCSFELSLMQIIIDDKPLPLLSRYFVILNKNFHLQLLERERNLIAREQKNVIEYEISPLMTQSDSKNVLENILDILSGKEITSQEIIISQEITSQEIKSIDIFDLEQFY